VAQPLYQIGLDATLMMLSGDTMPTTVGELPAPRGVDTLRNASPAPSASIPQPLPGPVAPVASVARRMAPAAAETAPVGTAAPAAPAELQETDALAPSGPTTSADQGHKKHLVTQAILWLVQVDEPERYTLAQAQTLLRRALYYSLRGLLHPFRDRAAAQWQQAKQDWEKSGEVAAKQKARKARRSREVDVDPASGPLSGR
jgi:lipoprotein-anchoring transpeptidase ErfK/SrfK